MNDSDKKILAGQRCTGSRHGNVTVHGQIVGDPGKQRHGTMDSSGSNRRLVVTQ